MSRIRRSPRRNPRAFTLVEILVVIAIILLTTIIALPTLQIALSGKNVVSGAQSLSAALAGARDAAIRQNEPRGIRLIPDPTLTSPAPGLANAGALQLAYSRMIPIEPAPNYSLGRVTIGPQLPAGVTQSGFPPIYPRGTASTDQYPFPWSGITPNVLMVEESPFVGGFATTAAGLIPNEPTNWYWNVRVGEKIKINNTGRAYTVVGPLTRSPWTTGDNPELFVNVGPPGTTSPLTRSYYQVSLAIPPVPPTFLTTANPEFLFLVNGDDDSDPRDGVIDPGWDGYNNNPTTAPFAAVDELAEWEGEKWEGGFSGTALTDAGVGPNSPSPAWITSNYATSLRDAAYLIERRPVPSPGAREVPLPAGVVIDATTWNTTRERSRLPVDQASLYVDIMLNPNGLYIPTTAYSTPTSAGVTPFYHFWLSEREDVFARGSVWGSTAGVPNPNPNAGQVYELPMSSDACSGTLAPTTSGQYYPPTPTAPVLKGDRRLVTMFGQTGMVVTNTIDSFPQKGFFAGEGFDITNVNQPYINAQNGQREVR